MDEPEFESNWCDLPPEFKQQCIQKMPITEERDLVDLTKFHLRKVEIDSNRIKLEEAGDDYLNLDIELNYRDNRIETHMIPLLDYIFKGGIIKKLQISDTNFDRNKETIIKKMTPMLQERVLQVKKIILTFTNNARSQFLLSKCDERYLEVVELFDWYDSFGIVGLPIKFIANDAVIGTDYRFYTFDQEEIGSSPRKIRRSCCIVQG
eukprot:NP_496537.2 Uncharacterized protein CELE_ZK930.5 [Caenorhabditis elegans]